MPAMRVAGESIGLIALESAHRAKIGQGASLPITWSSRAEEDISRRSVASGVSKMASRQLSQNVPNFDVFLGTSFPSSHITQSAF